MEYVCVYGVCVCVQCDHSVRRSGCYPNLSQHLGLKIPNGYFKISCSTSELQMKKVFAKLHCGCNQKDFVFFPYNNLGFRLFIQNWKEK